MPFLVQLNKCFQAEGLQGNQSGWSLQVIVVTDDAIKHYGERGVFKYRNRPSVGKARIGIGFAYDEWQSVPENLRILLNSRMLEAVEIVSALSWWSKDSSFEIKFNKALTSFMNSPLPAMPNFDGGPIEIDPG